MGDQQGCAAVDPDLFEVALDAAPLELGFSPRAVAAASGPSLRLELIASSGFH